MKNPLGTNRFEGNHSNEAWSSETAPQEPTRIEVFKGVESHEATTEPEALEHEPVSSEEILQTPTISPENDHSQITQNGTQEMHQKRFDLAHQILVAKADAFPWEDGGFAFNVVEGSLPRPVEKRA